jgi:hypothetical protein
MLTFFIILPCPQDRELWQHGEVCQMRADSDADAYLRREYLSYTRLVADVEYMPGERLQQ